MTTENPSNKEHIDEIECVVSEYNNSILTDPTEEAKLVLCNELEYIVTEDDGIYSHWVEFEGIPSNKMVDIVGSVNHDLAKQGYMFNTVNFENKRCRVIHTEWFERRLEW